MKTLTKVVDKKNAESAKMNEIVSNFKDRLMEKWQVLSDEYTQQFKMVEREHNEQQE